MPQARITELKLALAAFVNAKWSEQWPDRGVDDEVITKTRVDIFSSTNVGRKVYIFPVSYKGEPATREEDQDDYTLMVWVVERYREAGDPPDEWVDDRIYFVEWLLDEIGESRSVRLLNALWPQEAECTTVFDADALSENKQFVSVITITFREQR